MDIGKILSKSSSDYQLTVARSILSFSRADAATQAQLLDSYKAIIKEFYDAEARMEIRAEEDAEIRSEIQYEDEVTINIDEYLDDPRHGQAEALNEGR